MTDLSHDSPGVQGLAQLGRNAVDRVSELERAIAECDETIRQLRAEAAKWERLHDELYAEIASEHRRDNYGETETAAECVRRVVRERDQLQLEIAQGREDFATSYSQAEYEHAMSMYRDAAHERNSLLASIHRDGGHYQSAHGTAKAVEDAIRIVAERNAQLDEYEREKLKRESQEPVAFRWLGPGKGWLPVYAAPPVPHVDPDWLAGVIRLHSPHDAVYALAEKIADAINGRAK